MGFLSHEMHLTPWGSFAITLLTSWDSKSPFTLTQKRSRLEPWWLSGLLSHRLPLPHLGLSLHCHSSKEPSMHSPQSICTSVLFPGTLSFLIAPKLSPFFHLGLCLDLSRLLYLRYDFLFCHSLPLTLPWLFFFSTYHKWSNIYKSACLVAVSLDYSILSVIAGTLFTSLVL